MSTLSFVNLIPIFLVFILYFMGMPIVYALFGSTFFYFYFINTGVQPWTILQKVMNSTQSFSMLAIPFFVMSGSVMNYGGISDKMMDFCECVTGHMKGGLAQVNVLLSMLMGGCSGSANADCAMQSKMLVPEMEKRGYSKAFSADTKLLWRFTVWQKKYPVSVRRFPRILSDALKRLLLVPMK